MGHGNPVHPEGVLATFGGSIGDLGVEGDRGFCELAFPVTPGLLNALGVIQGGVVAVFLDAAMAYAIAAEVGGLERFSTVALDVRYVAGARGAEVTARGRVTALQPPLAFAEAELRDAGGRVCAKASSTCVILDPPPGGHQHHHH